MGDGNTSSFRWDIDRIGTRRERMIFIQNQILAVGAEMQRLDAEMRRLQEKLRMIEAEPRP